MRQLLTPNHAKVYIGNSKTGELYNSEKLSFDRYCHANNIMYAINL